MLGNLVSIVFSKRVFFAAYLSVVIHLTLLILSFNGRDSTYYKTICGPPWIYGLEEDEKSVTFAFGSEFGEGEDGKGETQEEGEGEGEGAGGPSDGFQKGKYEGGAWDNLVKDLESTSDLRKKFKNNFEDIIPNSGVSDSYIKRNREYENIIVKEVFPTLKTIHDPFKVEIEQAEDNLAVHKERNRIIEEFRKGEESSPPITMTRTIEGETRPKSPLTMPKEDRQRYLDKTLKQSKERQLDDFISKFMGYDPNKGDLNQFVRDLYYENLQRLAFQFSGDPTYFAIDYFQENLNKEDFLRQMMALLSQNLGTKSGTEILFTIENIYEIQGRALGIYFQNEALLKSLPPDNANTLRHETIRRVIKKTNPILRDKKIRSEVDVEQAYTKKRLDILDTLIKNSPEKFRWKDAYFQRGVVNWESGKFRNDKNLLAEAIKDWNRIPALPNQGDFLFEKSFQNLELTLRDFGNPSRPEQLERVLVDQIDMILRSRLSESMAKKSAREERLLWPKQKTVP